MIQLINITKSFSGCFEPILKRIDFELNAGDFCVIIGSNGSGKSTLMRTIAGEYQPNSGKIIFNGYDFTNKDRSGFIASVVQDVNKGTIPEMTLLENLSLSKMRAKSAGLKFYSRHQQAVIDKIKTLGIGLEDYVNRPLASMSGGQRQMVATLMAIDSRPQVLLLDEHTSALDPKMQKFLMEYTAQEVTQNKITSIMVTHKLEDAVKYGNRLIMLHKGSIVFDVSNQEKAKLSTQELLHLFHKYEDLTLL